MAAPSASSETSLGHYVPKIASSNNLQSFCDVEVAACECCGLTEECTPAYIACVRERFYGRWVCGLCGEAVKDELFRSEGLIGMEEAMEAHMTFCMQFRANPALRLVGAMRQLLRKRLHSSSSPRGGLGSSPTNAPVVITKENVGRPGLARATICFSTLARSQAHKYE